jgi:hypothetical protein
MAMKHLSENEIQEYLDNTISTGKQEIITHLDSCQLCRNRVNEYEALFLQLKKAEPGGLPADFASSVMTRIEAEAPAPGRRSVWSLILPITGVIVGLISIGYFGNLKLLLEAIKLLDARQYFDRVFFDELSAIAGSLNIDLGTILYVGLMLIIIAAIDIIIRHNRRRPISFLI